MKFDDAAGIGCADEFSRSDGSLADKKHQVPVSRPPVLQKRIWGSSNHECENGLGFGNPSRGSALCRVRDNIPVS